MEQYGLIRLPAPLSRNGGGQHRFPLTAASDPGQPVRQALRALEPLVFQPCHYPHLFWVCVMLSNVQVIAVVIVS